MIEWLGQVQLVEKAPAGVPQDLLDRIEKAVTSGRLESLYQIAQDLHAAGFPKYAMEVLSQAVGAVSPPPGV